MSRSRLKVLLSTLTVSACLTAVGVSNVRIASAAPPPPTGVDGVIGPEWNGVTPTFVPYDPNCTAGFGSCGGQLVAFNVYVRSDANYLYVAAQAQPAAGDQWNDAITLGNNTLANIYLDTDLLDGSDLLILPGGDDCTGNPGYENANGTPCNESNFGAVGPSVYYVATGGTLGGPNDSPPGMGGVAEMAISWTVLQTDPDNILFPKVVCNVNVRTIQAFGNNFSGGQFGTARFGTQSACSFAPGGGSFVIGDKESANGTAVTFWGAQWQKSNPTTGASKVSTFKGFAPNPSSPSCGVNWSSTTAAAAPNGPLPANMAVMVTSSLSQSGSHVSGDTVHIVIVKTNPGYQPSSGHPGTGTVIQQIC